MKKIVYVLFVIVLCIFFSACGNGEEDDKEEIVLSKDEIIDTTDEHLENNEFNSKYQYIGDYEENSVYQEIMQIEKCTDPEILCDILEQLYSEKFTYIEMKYNQSLETTSTEFVGYEEPYEDFLISIAALYNGTHPLEEAPITATTYVFLEPYTEVPSFVMDNDGTYIVSTYEISQFEDGSHAHNVNSWIISDLFFSLHGYIDCQGDDEQMNFMKDCVENMDYYMELENLIIDYLNL